MGREIKFRGWHKGINKWVYGFLTRNKNGVYFIENEDSHFGIADDESVGQYTGLKDKNGKEMYFDSDVVKVTVWHGYVAPSVCMSTLDVIDGIASAKYEYTGLIQKDQFGNPFVKDFYFANLLDADKYEFEVVGNIYENPELLEGTA